MANVARLAEDLRYTLHRAYTQNDVLQRIPVLPAAGTVALPPPSLLLVRAHDPTQAYAVVPDKPHAKVGEHRHPDWGTMITAFICPRVVNVANDDRVVFQAPHPQQVQYVMIKKLSKRIVHAYLRAGGDENPYKEVARMEEIGDNVHVLKCVEFLEDDDFLYIITPRACEALGTLKDAISWNSDTQDTLLEPHVCRQIFGKILDILAYLKHCGINHHDMSPDNFLFLAPDNLVVFDLALSLRIPRPDPATQTTSLIIPGPHAFGTFAWMPPEVFLNQTPYDGAAMDLWAAGVILYNLLTNQLLYEQPDHSNLCYYYFVHLGGLGSVPFNERTLDVLTTLRDRAKQGDAACAEMQQRLILKATAHLNMDPRAIRLLEQLLQEDPADRCTLEQAQNSEFVLAVDDDNIGH